MPVGKDGEHEQREIIQQWNDPTLYGDFVTRIYVASSHPRSR